MPGKLRKGTEIREMISRSGADASGAVAVGAGRSHIVSKPIANMLMRNTLNPLKFRLGSFAGQHTTAPKS